MEKQRGEARKGGVGEDNGEEGETLDAESTAVVDGGRKAGLGKREEREDVVRAEDAKDSFNEDGVIEFRVPTPRRRHVANRDESILTKNSSSN